MNSHIRDEIINRILNETMAKTLDKDKSFDDAEKYIITHYTKIIDDCNRLINTINGDFKLLENNLKIENDKLDKLSVKNIELKHKIKSIENIHYANNKSASIDTIINNFIPIESNQVNDNYVKYIIHNYDYADLKYVCSPIIKELVSDVNTNPTIYNFLFKNLKFDIYNLNNQDLLIILPHIEYFKINNNINIYNDQTIINNILNSNNNDEQKQNLLYKLILIEPLVLDKMAKNYYFLCFLKDTHIDNMSFLIYNKYSKNFINMYVNNFKYNSRIFHKILSLEPLLILLNNNINSLKIFNMYLQIISTELEKNYNLNKIIKVLELSSSNYFCNPLYIFFYNFFNKVNKIYLDKIGSENKIIFKCCNKIPVNYTHSDSDSDSNSDSNSDSDSDSDSDSNDGFNF